MAIAGPAAGQAEKALATAPGTSAEPTSFNRVAAHLDTGGNFYLYLSTEQWLTGLSDKLAGFRALLQMLPIGGQERVKANQVFDLITSLVKNCGLEEVSGVGMSSIATEKGFYRNKSILHHYRGRSSGYLWSMFGKAPHGLAGLDLLPESTALASFGDFDLSQFWNALQQEAARAGLKEASEVFNQVPALFEMNAGLKLDQLLASLGNEYGLVITFDTEKKIALPLPPNGLLIPEPGLMLVIKVKNDLVFDRVDQMLKQIPNLSQQLISVDKEGLRMRTLQVPLPLPIALRPTLARSGDCLFLATTDSLIQEALAVKSGQKKGFKGTDEYKRLAQGIPQQGNQYSIMSKKFAETFGNLQSEAMKANPMMPPAMTSWVQMMSAGQTAVAAFNVSALTDEGWVSVGNGTRDMRSAVLAPLAVVPAVGLMSAIAIPNFVRARTMAQGNACVANLKQIDGAKESWALENKKKTGDTVKMSDLVPSYLRNEPRCPVDGKSYILNPVGTDPTCSNYDPNNSEMRKHKLGAQ